LIHCSSAVQRDVLKLYRQFLKEVRKREPGERDKLLSIIRDRFKQGKNIPRRDFDHIEYKIRYGYRQLEVLRNTGVTGASSFTVQRIQTITIDETSPQTSGNKIDRN